MYMLPYFHDYMSGLWFAHARMIKLKRSINSCVYLYLQVTVLHILCVATKKLQLISISFATMNTCISALPLYLCVDYILRRHCMWCILLLFTSLVTT